ncbi:MAG: hypothetical protein EU548_06600 [Promethearchaeota archaeon]|nr:MAG: hypothetical protein EU548_06600 [Candidatus Lokiarchaeota archaeon]
MFTISSNENSPKTGFEKVLEFFNSKLSVNKPVDIARIEDETELSWTYVKRVLQKLKKEKYEGFHFKKLGNSWIAWKDREKIIKKLDNTCGHLLREEQETNE